MGWKKVQSKIKKQKRNKLAYIAFALVLALLTLSWSIQFTKSLIGSKSHNWTGEFNINLLVLTPQVSLFSYNPKEGKITLVNIPDETFLDVPDGFGQWQVRSVYGLGGSRLLALTMTSFFGIPVDGFLDISALSAEQSAMEFISGINLLSGLKTDLTPLELIRLKLGTRAVRFDKIAKVDLSSLGVLDKDNLPDGTPIFRADPARLDSVLAHFADPVILAEGKSVAVFNATDKPLLAQKGARLITNLGGNVIITSNAQMRLEKTVVTGEESKTLERLRQIFGRETGEAPAVSRAQINVFLGEDFAK